MRRCGSTATPSGWRTVGRRAARGGGREPAALRLRPARRTARHHAVYSVSLATRRPYAFWLFGTPVAWALMLGAPLVAAAVRAALQRDPAARALVFVVIVAALSGVTKAETERIWLFMVPWA